MAKLAIKGHPTRGKEVIEILEMLGGKRLRNFGGTEPFCWYYINENNEIDYKHYSSFNNTKVFTLEVFLEKFPYKVGDRVIIKKYEQIFEILSVRWCTERDIIIYQTSNGWYYVSELQLYKGDTIDITNKIIFDCRAQCCAIRNDIIKKEINTYNTKKVLDFIKHFTKNKGTIKTFTEGCCYWFAFILHTRFKGTIMYDDINNHFACKINNIIYDINGINNNIFVEWDNYRKIEPLNADRVIRDCIIFETK